MKTFQKISPLITLFAVVVIWYAVSAIVNAEILLPTPKMTVNALIEALMDKKFYISLLKSLGRILLSFSIAFVLAVTLATVANFSKVFEKLFYPIIVIVRATPTMSVIFLCLIWFSSKISPMIVATAVIFPVLYSSVLSAIKSCDKKLIEMSKVYEVPLKIQLKKLYLPWITERVFDDAVSTLSLNVKLIIAAEALAQTSQSIGSIMQISKANLETATLFAYTVIAVALGFLLEFLLKLIYKLARGKERAKSN